MDHMEEKILSIIDAHAGELQAMADDIFHHAEQGYHEYRTAQLVADYLKKLGLDTREGLAITGVKAAIGKGSGPNVALIGELDAVSCPTHPDASDKGYAHACGHYAQIVCMLGAALALSDPEVAASLDGTATIFAVPAEEFQDASVREEVRRTHDVHCAGGKCELLRRGEFDDVDLAVTTHSLMVGRERGHRPDAGQQRLHRLHRQDRLHARPGRPRRRSPPFGGQRPQRRLPGHVRPGHGPGDL